MDDVIYLRAKKFSLNMVQLIGSLIFVIGLIGFMTSIADLSQDWYQLSTIDECYIDSSNSMEMYACKDAFYEETGLSISGKYSYPTSAQRVIIIFKPLMHILFWMVIALLGMLVYSSGHKITKIRFSDKVERTERIERKKAIIKKELAPKRKK